MSDLERQKSDINRPIHEFISESREKVFWRVYQETGVKGELGHLYDEGYIIVQDEDVRAARLEAEKRAAEAAEGVRSTLNRGELPKTKKWGSRKREITEDTEFLL